MALRGFFVPREVLEYPMISYVGYSGYGEVEKLIVPNNLVVHDANAHTKYISDKANKVKDVQVIVAFTMKNVN